MNCETLPGAPDESTTGTSPSAAASIPPPLKFHPTRARRAFAARLAERHRLSQEHEADADAEPEPADPFADPADTASTARGPAAALFNSDDSADGGDDLGIVMRKGGSGAATSRAAVRRAADEGADGAAVQVESESESERAVGEIRDVFERMGIDVGDLTGRGDEALYAAHRERESDEDVEQHSSEEEEEEEVGSEDYDDEAA